MPVVAAFGSNAEMLQSLRRSLPGGGPWSLVRCRTPAQLQQVLVTRLVDAVVFSPTRTPLAELAGLRSDFPQLPWIAFAPFRPDDGRLLLECHAGQVALVLVDGVDNAVAGDLVVRYSAGTDRRRALADAPRLLRLAEPLQRQVWHYLLERVDRPIRTGAIARTIGCSREHLSRQFGAGGAPNLKRVIDLARTATAADLLANSGYPVRAVAAMLGVSREHLSRQFGAGGAPNLKRVIDLTRVACAASLLLNPGYDAGTVARILRFATASHLSATARRIAGVSTRGLGALGPRGVLAHFAKGKTRSRM